MPNRRIGEGSGLSHQSRGRLQTTSAEVTMPVRRLDAFGVSAYQQRAMREEGEERVSSTPTHIIPRGHRDRWKAET
jgi:hypothetical protein